MIVVAIVIIIMIAVANVAIALACCKVSGDCSKAEERLDVEENL